MNSIVVKNGLLASASAIVLGLIVYLISPKGFLTWGSWLTMVPVVYFMVQAAKETRENTEGCQPPGSFYTRMDNLPVLCHCLYAVYLRNAQFYRYGLIGFGPSGFH